MGTAWLHSTANIVTAFLVSWFLILLMYRLIPDTRVHWRPAMVGSFFAALAWEIGKWAFGIYVQVVAKNSIYGSLALLPLLMFWIYITWCVALLGIKVSYIQQYWPLLKRRFLLTGRGRGAGLSDLRWVLALGILLQNSFKSGKVTQVDEASELLMLPNEVTLELMMALEAGGLVHATTRGGYSLARPPESITAFDLLAAARAIFQVPPDLANEAPHVHTYPNSPALIQFEQLESDWARSHTLAQLADSKT
jgi:membrane protein